MKATNVDQCMAALHEIHQQIEREPRNPEAINKIAKFLDENRAFLEGNIKMATELNSIAVRIKTASPENALVNKIRTCVAEILPPAEETRNHSLSLLKRTANVRELADWIDLMEIPLEELPLNKIELFDLFMNEVQDIPSPSLPTPQAIGAITRQLINLNGQLNERQSKIMCTLAKQWAQQAGSLVAEEIQSFGIHDPEALIEIAKICASRYGLSTADHIDLFEIKDQRALVEIATLCMQQNAGGTVYNLRNFGITDDKDLAEILTFSAQYEGNDTALCIPTLDIKNAHDRFHILVDCIVSDAPKVLRWLENFAPFPKELEKIVAAIHVFQKGVKKEPLFHAIEELIEGLECSKKHQAQIKGICKKISECDPHLQQSQLPWLVHSLGYMTALDRESLHWVLESGLWNDLSVLRDPILKRQLTKGLFALARSEAGRTRWDRYLASVPEKKGMKLLAIPFFELEEKGIPADLMNQCIKNVQKPQIMKDALKIQRILQTAYLLSSTPILRHSRKPSAFRKTFLQAKILDNLSAAKALLQMNETAWVDSDKDVDQYFRSYFEKAIPLIKHLEDAPAKFNHFFANSRNPAALLVYAAGLKTLNEPDLLAHLGRYVASVFGGTFKSLRYDTTDNPHLSKIYEVRPDLKEKWSKCNEINFQQVLNIGSSQKEAFDTEKWIYDKLIRFKHLENEDVSFVEAYLSASSSEMRNAVKTKLSDEISLLSKSKQRQQVAQDPVFLNRKIQLACLNLLNAGNHKTLLELEKHFQALHQSMSSKGTTTEFAHEVKDLLESIESSKVQSSHNESYRVVITDDPIDLLLVGTDVTGSCQRVDGNPLYNRGLLAYLLDGKNQVLAIKDRSGKIVARAILRVLWDGNKPVLFREPFYPDPIGQKAIGALNQLALQAAKQLDLPLYESDKNELSGGTVLHALGGPVPYEYSDGSGGLKRQGIYSVENAKLFLNS